MPRLIAVPLRRLDVRLNYWRKYPAKPEGLPTLHGGQRRYACKTILYFSDIFGVLQAGVMH